MAGDLAATEVVVVAPEQWSEVAALRIAATLEAVVDHYNGVLRLGLTPSQTADLVQFLKSL